LVVPFIEDTTLIFKGGMDGRRADIAVGLFEFEEMAFVLHALREEELFVDVGANIGIYTVLAAGGGCILPVPGAGARYVQTVAREPAAK
jgi:hypothetical protein